MTYLPLLIVVFLAFYVAWNLGANDVANSMGTSVGSGALTLKKALIVAGVLEFSGAILFGQGVSSTLATGVAKAELFAETPQLLLLGMISVLLSVGLWLQIATSRGLPVASSHATVGAIAGFTLIASGASAINWATIGEICLAWIITPVLSGFIASIFYRLVRRWILEQPLPTLQLQEWIPWLSSALIGVFGIIVLPTVFNRPLFVNPIFPPHTLALLTGSTATVGLSLFAWNQLNRLQQQSDHRSNEIIESLLGRFQVLSACFVAFAHGSNDVGNAIAPLATIAYILKTNAVPLGVLIVPYWILVLGGVGIVAGLAVQGKKVIATVGKEIITLEPSSGFCAEIATATTILVASRFGLPVSTSHALVGSVIGIGLSQPAKQVDFSTVKSVVLAWVVTVPAAAGISLVVFSLLRWLF